MPNRRQSDAELQLQHIYSVFEQAPAMIALMQGPEHTFVFANALYLQSTGKTKAIIGKTVRQVFPELEQQGIFDILDEVYATGVPAMGSEVSLQLDRTNSGQLTEAFIDIAYQPHRDATGAVAGILTHAVDVSAQVLSRQRLEESEERFRTLIQQSTDAIQLVTTDGEVLYSSDSVMNVLGYTPQEILGVNVTPYIHPDDVPLFTKKMVKLLQRPRGHVMLEYRAKHKDGSWVWLETTLTNHLATPNIMAIVGNFRSITKRKAAEQALRHSEARLRRLVEANVIGIIFWHIEGGITYANDMFLQMVGYTADDLAQGAIDWLRMTPPEYAAVDTQAVQDLNKLGYHKPVEKEYVRKDGGRVDVMVGSAFFDTDKKEGIGFVLDVTDQKRTAIQRDRFKQTAALLEAQRQQLIAINQAKDEFISLASHQLRTPASAVKQYIGLVLEGYVGPVAEQQKHMLQVANESNERQIKVIDNLLRVAKADAGKIVPEFKPVDMAYMLADVVEEQLPVFTDRRQTVQVDTPSAPIMADADGRLVRMVLENIVDNASKYTPKGKAVSVHIADTADEVRISIADQGVGISKKDRALLFKKFTRINNPLSDEVGGTGLGLYWAKKVIDLHKGTITVVSRHARGTTFTVTLPKSQPAPKPPKV